VQSIHCGIYVRKAWREDMFKAVNFDQVGIII